MKGFSPRNLKYMRKFAEVWTDEQIVQQAAAQIPHNPFKACPPDVDKLGIKIIN
jgi:hypothetical protein